MRSKFLLIMSLLSLVFLAGFPYASAQADICWRSSYGRGVGVIPTACPSTRPQYDAGLCYPYCRSGFSGVGPMCWGSGWDFFNSYGRGVGTIPTSCQSGLQYDAGLCYTACRPGMNGVGPVCWGTCGGSFPVNCGASCASTSAACAEGVTSQVTSALGVLANIIPGGGGAVGKAGAAIAKTTVKQTLIAAAKSAGKSLAEGALESAATTVLEAQATGKFDFYSLDPTGIASVVEAYNKPICN